MPRTLLLSMSLALAPALFTSACAADPDPAAEAALKPAQWPFTATETARFDEPWAMTFLPDGSLLVTEKAGKLVHFDPASGKRGQISGVPAVAYGGQGGFGDVIVHPQFANNGLVYYSYAEDGDDDSRGAAVARATLELDADGGGRVLISNPGAAGRVAVRLTAGLAADWPSLPEALRHGVLRLAAFQYREREGDRASALPPAAVAALWRPWRRLRLA